MLETSMTAAQRKKSFEELYREIEALPEGITGQIIDAGVLTTMPRPNPPHRYAEDHVQRALAAYDVAFGGKGWRFFREIEVRLPDERLLVPDIAGWRVDRMPVVPRRGPLTLVPDWCCEVLSPSNARIDRAKKLPLYARSGVGWVWLVHPDAQTLEVFDTSKEKPILVAVASEVDVLTPPPFDIELSLGPWWLPAASE